VKNTEGTVPAADRVGKFYIKFPREKDSSGFVTVCHFSGLRADRDQSTTYAAYIVLFRNSSRDLEKRLMAIPADEPCWSAVNSENSGKLHGVANRATILLLWTLLYKKCDDNDGFIYTSVKIRAWLSANSLRYLASSSWHMDC
jgi:hypothetical protein